MAAAGGGSGGCKAAIRAGQCTIRHLLLSVELLDLTRRWQGVRFNTNKGRAANSATRAVQLPPQPPPTTAGAVSVDPSRYYSSA